MTTVVRRRDERGIEVVVAIAAVMAVVGAGLELSSVATDPAAIEWYRVVSFLYLAVPAAAFAAVALAVARRPPAEPIALIFALLAVVVGAGMLSNGYTAWELPGSDWVVWAEVVATSPGYGLLALALFLFPSGRSPSPRWRWLIRLTLVQLAVAVLGAAISPWEQMPYPNDSYLAANPIGLGGPSSIGDTADAVSAIGILLMAAALASLGWRWRDATGDERQQIKWMGLAGLAFAIEAGLGVAWVLLGEPTGNEAAAFVVGDAIFLAALTTVPVAIGLGIVRYRLYDIDRLISRTIAYGVLAALVAGGYVAVVLAVAAITGRSSTLVGFAVTAAVAAVIEPLRSRLLSQADRWVFGTRAAPYEVMADAARRLAEAVDPGEVLTVLAEAAGRAGRARSSRVLVNLPGDAVATTVWGDATAATMFDVTLEVAESGDAIGEIAVAGGAERPADRRLLQRVADVAGAAIRNVRLTSELETLQRAIEEQNLEIAASRERLIASTAEERRNLGRLIAGDVTPQLVALRGAVDGLYRVGGPQLSTLSGEMLERATSVVETVRALARGVMPSVLRDHGLAAALKATVRRAAMDGSVDVDLSLQAEGLDGDVEASLYLCGRAVIDHASTSGGAAVSISVTAGSDVVRFEMGHGGGGPPAAVAAADLATAQDRIVALGGVVEMVDVAGFRLTGTMPTMAQDTSLRKVSTA
ncbi:MAG TPA: hypothetical protein VGC11_03060 [Acidimicrobiia bacterium]